MVSIAEKKFDQFFSILAEEVKNLAVRLGKQGVQDKKVEKGIKSKLQLGFENPLKEWVSTNQAEGVSD